MKEEKAIEYKIVYDKYKNQNNTLKNKYEQSKTSS